MQFVVVFFNLVNLFLLRCFQISTVLFLPPTFGNKRNSELCVSVLANVIGYSTCAVSWQNMNSQC